MVAIQTNVNSRWPRLTYLINFAIITNVLTLNSCLAIPGLTPFRMPLNLLRLSVRGGLTLLVKNKFGYNFPYLGSEHGCSSSSTSRRYTDYHRGSAWFCCNYWWTAVGACGEPTDVSTTHRSCYHYSRWRFYGRHKQTSNCPCSGWFSFYSLLK